MSEKVKKFKCEKVLAQLGDNCGRAINDKSPFVPTRFASN